ncbi:hypothetical protein FJZ18_02990 [Candidatus Pacearchaeota archaeon]|nr:hypothetical protein [Candidatus Pacearchaeota archaeon]
MPSLKEALYRVWLFSKVERSKDKLVLETNISYKGSIIRQATFLFLFGSSLVALFLSGFSHFLRWYGIIVLSIIILVYGVLKAIVLPEYYFAYMMGYNITSKVDTSTPGRYKIVYTIIKKPKGIFKTEFDIRGKNVKGKNLGYHVDPRGYVQPTVGKNDFPWYLGIPFRINNFFISLRALSILILSFVVLLFSFFPIVNIILILMLIYSLVFYCKIQWKSDSTINKTLVVLSFLVLIVSIIVAITIYIALFVKF